MYRFLCPPPSTILSGIDSWFPLNQYTPEITVQITGEQPVHQTTIDWYQDNSLLDPSSAISAARHGHALKGSCVSKQLHINDADEKRKHVQAHVKINLGHGVSLGTFDSKNIKVISKPSKKRQSLKNMDLCIHHGSTVALFNRVRSQTVSTKYLGVSSLPDSGTCFVTRTSSWDPFLIWIVDLHRSSDAPVPKHHPDNPHYPAPPAIAIQTSAGQSPIALHYNQPIVLQCVTTGLVSPVMIIRRVDKASMVMGGNRVDDLSCPTGGEYGDEALGDPVSQLHKVAFQIVQDLSAAQYRRTRYPPSAYIPPMTEWSLPETSPNTTYLACLNEVVGMHKAVSGRSIVSPLDPTRHAYETKPGRKRRLSYQHTPFPTKPSLNRRRVNSLNDGLLLSRHGAGRRLSDDGTDNYYPLNGDCWTEDVSDASVWTIVGTDSVTYSFWTPPEHLLLNSPFSSDTASPITPFPMVHSTQYDQGILTLTGDKFSEEITVWLGDVAINTELKSKQVLSCTVPDTNELKESTAVQLDTSIGKYMIPILLVRKDGIVYNPQLFFTF